MTAGRRWLVQDRYGNDIYLTDERREHITENHPEMSACEEQVKETIHSGKWKAEREAYENEIQRRKG